MPKRDAKSLSPKQRFDQGRAEVEQAIIELADRQRRLFENCSLLDELWSAREIDSVGAPILH